MDTIDGATLDLGLSDTSVAELAAKPFEERTADEKDKMYSIIADKLNMIADHYHETKGSSVDEITSPVKSVIEESSMSAPGKSPRGSSCHGNGLSYT